MVEPEPSSPPRTDSIREAIGIVGAVCLLAAGGYWWLSTPDRPITRITVSGRGPIDPDYARFVGDGACRDCHPGESAAHARSGHAQSLKPVLRSPVARKLSDQFVEDPERPGVQWRFQWLKGKLNLERLEAGQTEQELVEYAFGSGHHATTFVTLRDRASDHPSALEHRLTYYAHSKSLGLTPGQSLEGHATGNSPSGRIHSIGDTLKCFDCHATRLSDRKSNTLDESTMIPNISCERCHGPGRSHVETARSGHYLPGALKMLLGPGRWSAREQVEQCGACHRLPEMVQPGSIRVDNPVMVRHQPVGLMQSACYLKSRGELSCTTCHDPHAKTSTDRAGYEANCLACHGQAPQKPCTVSPTTGCLECHMPRREVARGMIMTDHWIRRKPGPEIAGSGHQAGR